jgi:hypothetical protein
MQRQNRRLNKLEMYLKNKLGEGTVSSESNPPQFLDIDNTCELDSSERHNRNRPYSQAF